MGHTYNPKLCFLIAEKPKAQQYYNMVRSMYESCRPEEADVLVVLGGDGFMLRCIHQWSDLGKPFYGINLGNAGRLLNPIPTSPLTQQIVGAKPLNVSFLKMGVHTTDGQQKDYFAVNEVTLFRNSYHAVKLQVMIDGTTRLREFVGDGLLISTPIGSLAYNFSVGGPILPFQAPLLSMMPISPYQPKGWRGALFPQESIVSVRVLDPAKRPITAVADNQEVKDVAWVTVARHSEKRVVILFEKDHSWHHTVLRAQFAQDHTPHNRANG
jgi:NAD+ kinase